MKRYLYLFPLMAFTAATLTLGACDDKKKAEDQASTETTAPAPDTAMTSTAPVAATAVQAEGANAYATATGATTGAVFLTLHNPGAEADKLVSVKTDAATTSEVHESYVDDAGTMQMRKVDSVEIPAGQQVTLKPDGYHIMLMGLTKPLVEGETFNVTLTFEKAPEVTLPVTITAAGGGASTSAAPAPSTSTTEPMDHSTMTPSETSTAPTTEGTPDTTTPAPSETPPATTDTTAPAPTTSDAPGTTTDSTTAPSDSTSGDAKSAQ